MDMVTPGGEDTPERTSPDPGEDLWDDIEDKELEEFVQEHSGKIAEIKDFLTIAERQYKFVFFSDGKQTIKIKVKAAVPYEVRERQQNLQDELMAVMEKAREKAEVLGLDPKSVKVNILKLQKPMYEILAGLCLEAPWDDWRTWAVIDRGVKGHFKGSGMGPVMIHRIFETINKTQEDVKNFRGVK